MLILFSDTVPLFISIKISLILFIISLFLSTNLQQFSPFNLEAPNQASCLIWYIYSNEHIFSSKSNYALFRFLLPSLKIIFDLNLNLFILETSLLNISLLLLNSSILKSRFIMSSDMLIIGVLSFLLLFLEYSVLSLRQKHQIHLLN